VFEENEKTKNLRETNFFCLDAKIRSAAWSMYLSAALCDGPLIMFRAWAAEFETSSSQLRSHNLNPCCVLIATEPHPHGLRIGNNISVTAGDLLLESIGSRCINGRLAAH
jgi:hypothetical protein